jgi:hypothetical protein
MSGSLLDYQHAVQIGNYGTFQLIYVPLKVPDIEPESTIIGDSLAISSDGEVVAQAGVAQVHRMRGYSHVLTTAGIETHPQFRHRGLLNALLTACEHHFRNVFVSHRDLGMRQTADADSLWTSPKRTFGK